MTAEPWAPEPTQVSDRSCSTPDIGVGFDTVRLRGPAGPELFNYLDELRVHRELVLPSAELVDTTRAGSSLVPMGKTEAQVVINDRGIGLEVAVEFSGPSMRFGHNTHALPLETLVDTIAEAIEVVGERLPGFPRAERMRVVRLDLPRDFVGVPQPSAILTGLSRLHKAGRFKEHIDARTDNPNLVQTLTRRVPGRWLARGYDKDHEQHDKARRRHHAGVPVHPWPADAETRLRWELQLGHRTMTELRRTDPRFLGDPGLLRGLAADYFTRSEFDRVYQGGGTMFSELMIELSKSSEGRNEAKLIAAYVAAVSSGVKLQSPGTIDKARRALRQRGLTVSDLIGAEGRPQRLDFEHGRLFDPC